MNSLAVMAHKEISDRKPSYFFDLQDETSVMNSKCTLKSSIRSAACTSG